MTQGNDLIKFTITQPSDKMTDNPVIDDYSLATGKSTTKPRPVKKTTNKVIKKPSELPEKSKNDTVSSIVFTASSVIAIYIVYKIVRKAIKK